MATSTIYNIREGLLLKATNGANALQNAKNYIVAVAKGTTSGNAKVALSIFIPMASLDGNLRYWSVTDSYNNAPNLHFQVSLSSATVSSISLYEGANLISDATYEYYYC